MRGCHVAFRRIGTLRDSVERVVRASGLIVPTPDSASGEIHVVLNNSTDKAAAAAKGFGTGLTFGLVGSTVTDLYEMEVTMTANGKTFHKSGIRHALHSAVGNASLPEGLEPVPPATAFNRIVEQMLLNALKDFQESGGLMSLRMSLWNAAHISCKAEHFRSYRAYKLYRSASEESFDG